jgi:hypothetical protein
MPSKADLRAYVVAEHRRMKRRREKHPADRAYWQGRMDALRETATAFELFPDSDEEFKAMPD